MLQLGGGWDELLKEDFESPSYLKLREFLKEEYSTQEIYPSMYDIFNCFKHTPVENVKAVILGQDPYHGPNQAHGLCFSVQDGITLPPSLKNIYKELSDDLGLPIYTNGNLSKWADSGVLLLNTVMTVRRGNPNSHAKRGWELFTDSVIKKLSDRPEKKVFILWGGNARSKKTLIDSNKHLILESVHPSPLSCYNGFFGCKHFSKTNDFLIKNDITPIDWSL